MNLNIYQDQGKQQGTIIRKPGSKKLYVLFYYFSKRIEKTTGLDDTPDNRQKVRDWLDRIVRMRDKGRLVFEDAFPGASEQEKAEFAKLEGRVYSPPPATILFGEYLQHWTEELMPNLSSQNKIQEYEAVIKYWLKPYFKDLAMSQITATCLKRFILKELVWKHSHKNGQRLSRSRIRNIMIPFREIWNDACSQYNWSLPDPFTAVNKKNLPKAPRAKPLVFRFDEWQKLLECLDPHYRQIAEFFIITGLSGSELSGLRKAAVKDDHFVVEESIVRCVKKEDLKNEYRFRNIPLTSRIRSIIDAASELSESDYVFSMKDGKAFSTDNFRKIWMKAIYQAGQLYRKPYVTRHTFAAWSLCIRIDPNRLVDLMGHGSKKMIYETYGKYVQGLEKDRLLILAYLGHDFIKNEIPSYPTPFLW